MTFVFSQLQLIHNRWLPQKHVYNSSDEEPEPNPNLTFTELEPNMKNLMF